MARDQDRLINDFALRCFRDIGDGDYIAARMAYRARLVTQCLWASQQMAEKYLKCILLLNRIPAKRVKHNLGAALAIIDNYRKTEFELSDHVRKFIDNLDRFGKYRYLEVSNFAFGWDILMLDRTAWELRRYCTLATEPLNVKLRDGFPAPKVRLPGGFLEKIIDDKRKPAREPLLWQNALFGKRVRRKVKLSLWWEFNNSPLALNPQLLDEILKYVLIPKEVQDAFRKTNSS